LNPDACISQIVFKYYSLSRAVPHHSCAYAKKQLRVQPGAAAISLLWKASGWSLRSSPAPVDWRVHWRRSLL